MGWGCRAGIAGAECGRAGFLWREALGGEEGGDTQQNEAEDVLEALRMELAWLERQEAEGQRLVWEQARAGAGCSRPLG